jgi:hypothetical protein
VFAGGDDPGVIYRSDDNGADWSSYDTGFDRILALASVTRQALPTDPVPAPSGSAAGVRYFPQTHHTLKDPFLHFYNQVNGLKIFGLPLTEAFDDGGQIVQYFERSELVAANGRVSIEPLGSQLTASRHFPPLACCPPGNEAWFSQTRHWLTGQFLAFWRSHKGPTLFGMPISQPLHEQNGDGTGRTYLVQYFQNARMEYHPELAGTRNVVTLGLLGRQALQQRGWL